MSLKDRIGNRKLKINDLLVYAHISDSEVITEQEARDIGIYINTDLKLETELSIYNNHDYIVKIIIVFDKKHLYYTPMYECKKCGFNIKIAKVKGKYYPYHDLREIGKMSCEEIIMNKALE